MNLIKEEAALFNLEQLQGDFYWFFIYYGSIVKSIISLAGLRSVFTLYSTG